MIDFSGTQKRIVILFVALVLSRELVHAEDTPLYKTNRLAQITDAIFTALQEDTYHEQLLLHTAAPHDALIGAATYAQQLMMQEDTALKALGSPEEIRLLRTVLEDELASYKRASQCATPEKLLTRIPAIAGQDETVAGNFANWGTTTIETGLVINNNNGGTVAAPALQVASFTSNLAALVTTTAGQNILQVSTNTNQPALSIANAAGVYASAPGGTSLLVNGPGAFISSSGLTLTVTGNASNPAALLVGNSSTTAPALRLSNNPSSSMNDFALTIDASGNVKQSGSSLQSGFILNGGQPGPLTIGTTTTTGINFIINNITELSMLQNGNTIITGSLGIGTTSPITQLEVVQFNPVLTGSAATGTAPYALVVQGRYAYVPSRTSNLLQIFDVSNNPANPTLIGSIGTGLNQPYSVDVEGHYAYVVNLAGATLQVFDVSTPSAPTLVGTSATTGLSLPVSVSVQGRYAYVANSGSSNTVQVFDVANPANPLSIGSITTRSTAPRVLVVQGRYLYVVEFGGAFEIFDISNPAQLVSVGFITTGLSSPAGLYVQGRYAYVTNFTGNTLQIFDISNPSNPTLVGTATGLVEPGGVSVQGRYAYVLNSIGSGTLQIFDVSTPSAPVSVGIVPTGSADPLNIFVQGRYAYFTSDSTGSGANTLQVIDLGGAYIQQLEAGSLEVGTLQTRENMTVNNDLDVVGGAIFGQGFQSTGSSSIVTATNATVPALRLIGNGSTTAPALQLNNNPAGAITDFVLTTDSSGAVKQSASQLQSQFILNGGQTGPLTIGTTSTTGINFIANNATVMTITASGQIGIGTTAPFTQFEVVQNTPKLISTTLATAGGTTRALCVQGRYAYVINQNAANMQVFDVSNPASPLLIATLTTGTTPDGICVQGKYLYIVNYTSSTLQVIDISNPYTPTIMNGTGTATGTNPTYVAVQGRYVYVTSLTSNALQIFDVGNPSAPVLVGSLAIGGATPQTYAVFVQGRYAYLLNYNTNTLEIVDVSDPANPTQVSLTTTNANPNGIYVQGRYVYIVNRTANSLQIVDAYNPAAPVVVSTTTTTGQPFFLTVQGRYAYLTNTSGNTLQIFDVSNPGVPILVGTVGTGNSPEGIAIEGRYIYLVNAADSSLQIFDSGGAYIQQFEAGGMEVGTLQTRGNLTVNNDFDTRGGASFGQGFQSTGASSITTNSSAAGFQNVSGLTISVGAQNAITTSAGTVSLPAYSFTGNTAAGLYAPATNQLALVTSNTARLIVDSTGSVSCFSNYKVHAFPSGTQTCASGSTTVINFGTTTFDPQNSFVINGYTAPLSGYYFVAVQVSYIIGAANLAFTRTLGLTKNGTALAGYGAVALTTVQPTVTSGTVTGPYNLDTACIVQLNQGDILRATWTQSSGAADTIQTSGTHIDIHFISTV